jgi:hypothetical protein
MREMGPSFFTRHPTTTPQSGSNYAGSASGIENPNTLIIEAPRSGPLSLAPVSAKELKEGALQGVLRALLLT